MHIKNLIHNTCLSIAQQSRRDFLKICGAATLGGTTGFFLPRATEALPTMELLQTKASRAGSEELFWEFVRSQFVLRPGFIYMNTGTEGSMPRCVLKRLKTYFKEFAENPWNAVVEDECFCYFMDEIVKRTADFLGADEDEIVMTTNTTEGMSFVANGLDIQEGDEVLTTLHEHEGGLCCWHLLRDRKKVTVTELELPTPTQTPNEIVAIFANAITPNTKVMSFCHINFTTGLRMPVKELCQLANDNGIISVVDGAHAIGMLDFDLHELGCNFYACSPHKWLCAPPGTGVLYMRKDVQNLLWPTVAQLYTFAEGTRLFQFRGQQCTPAYTGVIDAIDFQLAISKKRIQNRILALSNYLKDKIIENWGEGSLFSPLDEDLSSGLVSFNPGLDGKELQYIASTLREKYRTVIRTVGFKDKHDDEEDIHALRASTHIYNDFDEINNLINNIKTIISTS